MNPQTYFLLLLMLTPLLTFALHFVMIRALRLLNLRFSPLLETGSAVGMGYLIVAALTWQSHLRFLTSRSELIGGVIYGSVVYGCLSFSYFILFAMTESARRIRILSELYLRGELNLSQLASEYGADTMMKVRLDRMVELKQLKRTGDRYMLNGKLLYLVGKLMSFWSRLLRFSQKANDENFKPSRSS